MNFRSTLLVLLAFISVVALVIAHPSNARIASDIDRFKFQLDNVNEYVRIVKELQAKLITGSNAPYFAIKNRDELNKLTEVYGAWKNLKAAIDTLAGVGSELIKSDRHSSSLGNKQNGINFTFVPPPKVDITPELLNQSLKVQPQNTATISSVIPLPKDGVITFHVQLNGFVASTMKFNASMSLPCGDIGSTIEPNLIVLPKNIKSGTPQVVVPDCHIIAVNMLRPATIDYWVQKEDGSIFALVGDNKVHGFDQINTEMDVSLVIRSDANGKLQQRGMVAPDVHTATMTPEVCKGMSCINNDNKSAVYNPFTRACWCIEPAYVEVYPSESDVSK